MGKKKDKVSILEYMPPESALVGLASMEPPAPPSKPGIIGGIVRFPFRLVKMIVKLPLRLLGLPIKLLTWPFRRPNRGSSATIDG